MFKHSAKFQSFAKTFQDGLNFNEIKWETIQIDQLCWDMQLLLGFDPLDFPFVLTINKPGSQVFLVNTKTK